MMVISVGEKLLLDDVHESKMVKYEVKISDIFFGIYQSIEWKKN